MLWLEDPYLFNLYFDHVSWKLQAAPWWRNMHKIAGQSHAKVTVYTRPPPPPNHCTVRSVKRPVHLRAVPSGFLHYALEMLQIAYCSPVPRPLHNLLAEFSKLWEVYKQVRAKVAAHTLYLAHDTSWRHTYTMVVGLSTMYPLPHVYI
jgi:hypothetical protein